MANGSHPGGANAASSVGAAWGSAQKDYEAILGSTRDVCHRHAAHHAVSSHLLVLSGQPASSQATVLRGLHMEPEESQAGTSLLRGPTCSRRARLQPGPP